MAASASILADKLHEYPQQDVIDGSVDTAGEILDDCLNKNDGVLQLLHRYAGRTFCTPGKRLRLAAKSYYPDYMNGTGLDEVWMCCTVPIVTGVIDTRTNKAPFREGESHVLTPNGHVISLQDLIVELRLLPADLPPPGEGGISMGEHPMFQLMWEAAPSFLRLWPMVQLMLRPNLAQPGAEDWNGDDDDESHHFDEFKR